MCLFIEIKKLPSIAWTRLSRDSVHIVHICLLTNQDLDDPSLAERDWPCDPRPFIPDADWHLVVLRDKASAPTQVEDLICNGVNGHHIDVFFNMCDGAADQPDLPGIEVVEMMELHGVAFTGATSECYEPTRIEMKDACARIGIAAPAYVFARTEEDVEQAAQTMTFPLFVKHYSSYASVDLSRRSKVMTPAGLRIQARKIISRHGAALIEQYIDGIECTVLVAENPADPRNPTTYTPVQYEFPKGEHFKHSDLKWVNFEDLSTKPVEDQNLDARLRDEVARFFVEIRGASFGRCDLRVDRTGTPYMLEINANCGVFFAPSAYGSADFCLSLDPEGHEGFARQLIAAACARHAKRHATLSQDAGSI